MNYHISDGHKESRSLKLVVICEWLPLMALTAIALVIEVSEPWARMLLVAVAIFVGFKWVTWQKCLHTGLRTTGLRSLAYFFLWPGMDAQAFLSLCKTCPPPALRAWLWSATKVAIGASLIWGCVRFIEPPLAAGWTGMIGLMFLLHFGLLEMLALFWQRQGICAQPLMNAPFSSSSLREFWGRRWNSGFRIIAFDLMFHPLTRWMNLSSAMIGTFLISGLIHDLVISAPIAHGYGRPTAYFLIQGAGILFERSRLGRWLFRLNPTLGRVFTLSLLILPAGWLFPPLFVEKITIPFLQMIGAF